MFVDTVDLGRSPGAVAIIECGHLNRGWGNTHQAPLSVIMKYISELTEADTFLLGIQPENISPGNGMSPQVKATVKLIANFINEIIRKRDMAVLEKIT